MSESHVMDWIYGRGTDSFSSSVAVPTREPQENTITPAFEAAVDDNDLAAPARLVFASFYWQKLRVGAMVWLGDQTTLLTTLAIVCGLTFWFAPAAAFFSMLGATIIAQSISFWFAGLYPGVGLHPARELRSIACSVGLGLAILSAIASLQMVSNSWILPMLMAAPIQVVAVALARGVVRNKLKDWGISIPIYFVGSRQDTYRAYTEMCRFGNTLLTPVARFCDDHETAFTRPASSPLESEFEQKVAYSGGINEILNRAQEDDVYWLFVVGDLSPRMERQLANVRGQFPEVVYLCPTPSLICNSTSVVNYGLTSGVRREESLILPDSQACKRMIDLVVSLTAITLLLPVMAAIALSIKLSSPGPIMFSHKRIGLGGRRFHAWKFRSMVPNAPQILQKYLDENPELRAEWELNQKLKNDPRITWIGKIIRRTSLDELPQLFNVFLGHMSLVGPRPIVDEEIRRYGQTFRQYLRVTPGITGLWQISGRNNTTYEERLAYDEYYVQNWSPWLDLYILLRTFKTVLLCEGAC